jgi:dihydrofolate reductase
MSLDGFIAGPNGEIDWISPDPSIDFASIYAGFDAALLGRRTYELTQQPGAPPWPPGWDVYVVSRTLRSAANPAVRIIGAEVESVVRGLRASAGGDIWLFGGGDLAASLINMNLVDVIEVAIMPVILGAGVPFIASGRAARRCAARAWSNRPRGSSMCDITFHRHLAHEARYLSQLLRELPTGLSLL